MTYTEQDKKLIEEFQNFADSIVWSNDDGSEKYIGVGNMADWWLDKIHQAIAEERESVRAVIEKLIEGNDAGLWGCRESFDKLRSSLQDTNPK